jgi:hypothetical protein
MLLYAKVGCTTHTSRLSYSMFCEGFGEPLGSEETGGGEGVSPGAEGEEGIDEGTEEGRSEDSV